jgi:starch phosphorylase
MRALRSFIVGVKLPDSLTPLHRLATNLRWSWDERTRDLFRWVDPDRWELTGHDPLRLLTAVDPGRLETLATDPAFTGFLSEVGADLDRYLEAPLWFQGQGTSELRGVAYFSPEFGIAEALPQYSGGLGVLAGDHLKAAGDLGVPLVGVGLLYRYGYFRQDLGADGWQQESYPVLDPHALPVRLVEDVAVEIDLAGQAVVARVWCADVGRVHLYLLDTNVDGNDGDGRAVTDRLYGGDTEHRLRQEILLGVGGVRALDAVGEAAQVYHSNEGHAGFLGLERIRRLVVHEGLTMDEALEAVRAGTVFTTHTPVPAGIDRFPRALMERYFSGWAEECGVAFDRLMALGHLPGEAPDAAFNMAVMGLRLAGAANGVSRLHRAVSRAMFGDLWPDIEQDDVPIGSVTNGVHPATWVSPEMGDLLTRGLLPAWADADPTTWARIEDVSDDEIWRVREQCRERLVGFVRSRVGAEVLDPAILTIGFARRFVPYKRATLLLSQLERLTALLESEERPVQLVLAGKAHPADDAGKEMIRRMLQFSRQPSIRGRVVFVEDYDIAVGLALCQGCDVWLNIPRRPQEACGTSGQKAALNGALNVSILDGWWDEWFDGDNGWAVASAERETDEDRRDDIEGNNLFDALERQVVPLFYDRPDGSVPTGWVCKIKSSLGSLGPRVAATRMVRDYTRLHYEPAARRVAALSASGHDRARSLARWKAKVSSDWPEVRVLAVDSETTRADLGAKRRVDAAVALGSLHESDVTVELVHGPVGADGGLTVVAVVPMTPAGPAPGEQSAAVRYTATFACEQAGRYGFTVRAVASHDDLASPYEMGLAAWA